MVDYHRQPRSLATDISDGTGARRCLDVEGDARETVYMIWRNVQAVT